MLSRRPGAGFAADVPIQTAIVGGLIVGLALLLSTTATAEFQIPDGFAITYQSEFSQGQTDLSAGESEEIFENWIDLDHSGGNLTVGLRWAHFNPPDPSIFSGGTKSTGIDLLYGEYAGSNYTIRGGDFYALFGRGLGLRVYEDRVLRVDTNLRGAMGTFYLPDGEIKALSGQTIKGNAENAKRGRSELLHGIDVEHGLWEPAMLRLGGSWATTELKATGGGLEPLRLKTGRASATVATVDLVGEFGRVDGPNELGARRLGFSGPNFHGHGVYGSASTTVGSVGLLFEYKDYDAFLFRNEAGIDHIVPPAAIRDHTFSLLNRHPHQIDTGDERGFQVEATWVTDALQRWCGSCEHSSFLANWSRTRNHEAGNLGNYFEDRYFELVQEMGENLSLIAGLSYQKGLGSTVSEDPYRRLWTPVTDLRYRFTDVYAVHAQFEHQHDRSEFFGEFDTELLILEWTRSPNLTLGLLAEVTNKSDVQLGMLAESDTRFLGASLDLTLFNDHDLRLFYGTRNAGFICVGGVCRLEPAFDGFEASLIGRF